MKSEKPAGVILAGGKSSRMGITRKVLLELDADQGENKPVVVVSYQGMLQPTFSMWRSHHLPVIHEAVVNKGMGGLNMC